MTKLEDIQEEDFEDVKRLTSTKSIMKYVGNGDIWGPDKIDRFISYNLQELSSKNRRQYYYKITDNKFVGIIGIHPFLTYKGYYLSVMILPEEQQKGYYKESIEKLKDKIKKEGIKTDRIKILVRTNNKRMISLCENNYYYNRERKIKGESFYEFFYFLRKYTYVTTVIKEEDNKITGEILEKRGNWERFNPKIHKSPDFIHLYPYAAATDKKYFSMNCLLKNIVSRKEKITNKNNLFQELEKIPSSRKYLIANYKVDIKNIDYEKINYMFKKYKVLIFKPIFAGQGHGIEVFDSFSMFKNFVEGDGLKKNIKKINTYFNNRKKVEKFNHWVLQEYIANPMLLDGKKFHVRGYLITFAGNLYLMKHGKIVLAKENYKKGDYKNRKIHDTHIHGQLESLKVYPDDLPVSKIKKNDIIKQIENLFKIVGSIEPGTKCYEESKNCYQLYGFDVIITQENKVKIIEINSTTAQYSPKFLTEKELFENQIKLVVDHIFPPKNKVDEDSDFIQVY